MQVIDKFVLRSSLGLIALGAIYFFFPGTDHATWGWDFIARTSFVVLLAFILLIWAHGMRTNSKRGFMLFQMLVPLFALMNVMDTISARGVRLPLAMELTGGMLALSGFCLILLFGISFKKASGAPLV